MKKDNMTDVVENLPQSRPPTPPPQPPAQQQVVNNAGETVTLGQPSQK